MLLLLLRLLLLLLLLLPLLLLLLLLLLMRLLLWRRRRLFRGARRRADWLRGRRGLRQAVQQTLVLRQRQEKKEKIVQLVRRMPRLNGAVQRKMTM